MALRIPGRKLWLLPLGVSLGLPAHGAQWTTSAGIAPSIIYTDNICQDDDDKQGEWIGVLTPDVAIEADGSRANFQVAAALDMNTLSDSRLDDLGCKPPEFGNRKQFTPYLNAGADAVLVDNWFYIDANANVSQNAANPFLTGGDDSLNRLGNTNTTYRYAVSPYLSHRFKDVAVADLRYTWDDQANTVDTVGDSTQQTVAASVGSVPGEDSFSWGVQGDYDRLEYSKTPIREESDSELKSMQLNLGYQFNRIFQVNAYVGEERNDFVSSFDEIDGDFWDVGVRWTPNSRTTIEAGVGDRFFGDTPRFSIEHQHKRSVFSASYVKDLRYDRELRVQDDNILSFNDQFGQPTDPLSGQSQQSFSGVTTITDSPIVDERFSLRYSYQGRQTTIDIEGTDSDQTRAEDLRQSNFRWASVLLSRSVSSNLTYNGGLRWREEVPQGDPNGLNLKTETWNLDLGVLYSLGENASLSFDYRYTDRESDNPNLGYKENRISLTLRQTF